MRDIFEEIAALRAEVKNLRTDLDETREILKNFSTIVADDSDETTKQIKNIYGRLTEHSELLYPVLRKVFPNMAAEQRDALAWVKRQPKD